MNCIRRCYNISIFIGDVFYAMGIDDTAKRIYAFRNTDEANAWLEAHPIYHSGILIKGSRGVGLEKIVSRL